MDAFSSFNLQPYSGEWNIGKAAHLLRRTTFGPTRDEILDAASEGMYNVVNRLLEARPLPDPPINFYYEGDPNVAIGETWIDAPYTRSDNSNAIIQSRLNSLNAWITGLTLEEGVNIREKMTLFWHNHFVTGDIRDARFVYRNLDLYRRNALGNFRELTKAVTVDPAMLVYLNGNQNTYLQPNENYARELLELFTIGKGPAAAEGDYTNYTEHDVAAIAKVLTGWRDTGYFSRNGEEIGTVFRSRLHDPSAKSLSHRFGKAIIPNLGNQEYAYLIDIIFRQDEVARFIVRKIYRWFVYYEINEKIESTIIQPLSELLIKENYEINPVIEMLLLSDHFYDPYAVGSMIKNPLDFSASLIRQLQIELGDQQVNKYEVWRRLYGLNDLQQMAYFSPPNVAGWKAYYQQPLYYRTWINSSTLSFRSILTLLAVNGIRINRFRLQADLLGFIRNLPGSDDPNTLIDQLIMIFLPYDLAEEQKDYLKSVLLPGLPDYEWTTEYNRYLNNPGDNLLREAVLKKLRDLVMALLVLPEFQLS